MDEENNKEESLPAIMQNKPHNSLDESLIKMGKELAERAKIFTDIENSLPFGLAKDALKTIQQYQETIAEVQKEIQPYTKMMVEAQKQWEKQRELIMPAVERMVEPIRIVQEAINRYPKIESSFLNIDPIKITPSEVFSSRIREDKLMIKIDNLEKKIQEFVEKEKAETKEIKRLGKYLIYHTNNNVELKFNKENGNVELGEVKTNVAPGTQEHDIFVCLLESSSFVAEYKKLLEKLYPGREFNGSIKLYPSEQGALECAVKKLKMLFKILPRNKSKNKDIFRAIKRKKSYSLLLKD